MYRIKNVEYFESEEFRFRLDSPVIDFQGEEKIQFRGWFVSLKEIKSIYYLSPGGRKVEIKLDVFRPGVKKSFSQYFYSDMAGFEFSIVETSFSEGDIFIDIEGGELIRLARISYENIVNIDSVTQKILYVHIAKTAGTSLNNFIASHFSTEDSLIHLESSPLWPTAVSSSDFLSKKFISGHLRYCEFKKHLDIQSFYKVVTFRDPVAHIFSHLAWIRHFSEPHKKNLLGGYPTYIQELSKKLFDADLSSASDIECIVSGLNPEQNRLLDNTQTSYLAPLGLSVIDENAFMYACESLQEFDAVGLVEKYDALISKLCTRFSWVRPDVSEKHNQLENKFGLSKAQDILAAVEPLIRWDRKLYKYVEETCEFSDSL
ncbi:MAG: hypothetical protein K6L73_04330 [Cellvibrionaceae bacterium]